MATFDYNPITGQLDLVGSGASYINGVVADPTALPVTLGTPPLDSVYLCKAGSGVWLINRRPAGLYVRVANNGVAADWTYLGAFPEVNADANWELYNSSDPTKELKFDLSGLPTGTTRTVTGPAGNGQMMVSGQAGSFTTLAANNGTLTASAPVLDLAQTWNASGTTFTGLRLNVTNTASAAASLLADLQVGGATQFWVNRAGVTAVTGLRHPTSTSDSILIGGNAGFNSPNLAVSSSAVRFSATLPLTWGPATNHLDPADLVVVRDAADTLAQRRTTNPQTFNIYNTFTSSTNYERGFLRWSSNVFQIGTEAGSGGGSVRNVEIRIGGQSPATFAAAGSGVALTLRNVALGTGFSINNDVFISRDAANVMCQINGTNAQAFRIYNTASGTNNVNFDRVNFRWASNEFIIDAEAGGTGTLRGIKIGSATSSLLGFYGATPVDRPATVADPAGGGTIDAEARTAINDIIDRLQELGLIA